MAGTVIGRPTQNIAQYTRAGYPLSFYEAPGLELSYKYQKQLANELYKLIKKLYKTKNPKNFIHCIWYCINCASNRIEELELEFIKKIRNKSQIGKIPVIIVLTQCYVKTNLDKMIDLINNLNLDVIGVVPVIARKITFCLSEIEERTINSYGLDKLIETMSLHLPEIFRSSISTFKLPFFLKLFQEL